MAELNIEWTPCELRFGEICGYIAGYAPGTELTGITSLTFNQETMANGVDLFDCNDLVTVSFPNLTGFTFAGGEGYIAISDCDSLTTVSLPLLGALTGVGSFYFISNTSLTTIDLSSYVPPNGGTHNFSGNALSEATVDLILARFVANPACVSGTLNLNGGTNSAPGVQGALDKATLQGRGMTVNTN